MSTLVELPYERIWTNTRVARKTELADYADFPEESAEWVPQGVVQRFVAGEVEVFWLGTDGLKTWVLTSELVAVKVV